MRLWVNGVAAGRLVGAAMLASITILFGPGVVQAQDAGKILKAMSDYVGSQKTISATFDADIEVVTPEVQKIQFTNSGQVLLSRPDKLRATRTGGYSDVELIFDGKTLTVLGKNLDAFTQVDSPGSIDQLIDRLRDQFSVAMPGADLLRSNSYDELMADVIDAKHIGRGVIDGVECEHLAFRNSETDWQIWVEVGSRPIPRKYVITSKAVGAAPQYTVRIKDWKTDVPIAANAFEFTAPAGAKKVDLAALSNIDEIPHGIAAGGTK